MDVTWVTTAIAAAATLFGVFIGGRLNTRAERRQWLRDNQLRVCVNLIEQVESFISEADVRRTDMDKSVGTLLILGPAEFAGQAGILVSRAAEFQAALFGGGNPDTEGEAFRKAEWSFRAAATKALGIKNALTMADVDQATARPAGEEA